MPTSALTPQGVVIIASGAGGLDPVPVVLLVLNHATDVDLLERALVQQSQRGRWQDMEIQYIY